MDKTKQSRLEGAGWRVGDTADFFELTSEEAKIHCGDAPSTVALLVAIALTLYASAS